MYPSDVEVKSDCDRCRASEDHAGCSAGKTPARYEDECGKQANGSCSSSYNQNVFRLLQSPENQRATEPKAQKYGNESKGRDQIYVVCKYPPI